jgi:dienelactone hydrolase
VTRHDVRFPSGTDTCGAWLFLPDGVTAPPVVVLGHGLGGTREMGLAAYAERFAQAGVAALAFTYRHFGDSTGEPRQLLSIRRQRADWDATLAQVATRTDVDTSRVAIWGSSFGGGHAIVVAARHPELRAAVAQCPFTDGPASSRALGLRAGARLAPRVVRDLVAAVRGREPVHVAVVGAPGEVALMTAPDALPGYRALLDDDTPFVNEVPARVAPTITLARPGRSARRVRVPILFCLCEHDSVASAERALAHARTAPHGEIRTYDAGHFDIYTGTGFEAVVTDQVAFLLRHLAPG